MTNAIRLSIVLSAAALAVAGCSSRGSSGATGPGVNTLTPPTLTAIAPQRASPAMQVTLTGTDFGSAPTVLVGGAPATIVSASATSVVIHPPAGAPVDDYGIAPVVVVTSAGVTSNAVSFTPGVAGESDDSIVDDGYFWDGDIVVVGTKAVIATGRTEIGYNGDPLHIVDLTTQSALPVSYDGNVPYDMAAVHTLDSTHVYAMDSEARIYKVDVDTGDASIYRNPSLYGATDFVVDGATTYIAWAYGDYVAEIDASGNLYPYFISAYQCNSTPFRAESLAALNGELYMTPYYYYQNNYGAPRLCYADEVSGGGSFPLPVTLSGTVPASASRVRVDGTDLALSGQSTTFGGSRFVYDGVIGATPNLVTLSVTGAAVPNDFWTYNWSVGPGLFPLGGGEYLETTATGLYQVDAAGFTPLVMDNNNDGIVGGVFANGKLYKSLASDPSYGTVASVNELDPATGALRTLTAQTRTLDQFGAMIADAQNLYVTGFVGGTAGTLEQISIATGAVTPLITDLPAPIRDLARDANGNFYLLDGTTSVAKYDGQGGLINSAFITLPTPATTVTFHGSALYFVSPNEIDSVGIAGGVATPVNTVALDDAHSIAFDASGSMSVMDAGSLYRVNADGSLTPWLSQEFSIPVRYDFLPDGRIFVVDLNYGVGIFLP